MISKKPIPNTQKFQNIFVSFKLISTKFLSQAKKIDNEYLGCPKFEYYYKKFPQLFCGAFQNDKLIGICYGYPHKIDDKTCPRICLSGIAIKFEHWRKGYGTKLLHFFEKQISSLKPQDVGKEFKSEKKCWKITLGSANGFVENFYISNGFIIVSHCIKIKTDELLNSLKCAKEFGYKIDSFIRKESECGKITCFYVPTNCFDLMIQKKIKKDFKAKEVIFIFEKEVLV